MRFFRRSISRTPNSNKNSLDEAFDFAIKPKRRLSFDKD